MGICSLLLLLDPSKCFSKLIKGMTSTLYHHQLLGTHWMVSRELSSVAPFGGLLADGMGLGKTIETLACMVGHPPSINDKKRGIVATLIVVPSSVISQWKDEIGAHTDKMTLNKASLTPITCRTYPKYNRLLSTRGIWIFPLICFRLQMSF